MADETVTEEWRVVEGWPDYEVSSLGRVRRSFNGFVMKLTKLTNGYLIVGLYRGGEQTMLYVNVLICEAFHGPRPSPRHEAAHDDGVRVNNVVTNLSWKTTKENAADRIRHGTQARGERTGNAVLTESIVREIRTHLADGTMSMGRLAARYGVCKSNIGRIKYGKTWRHIP